MKKHRLIQTLSLCAILISLAPPFAKAEQVREADALRVFIFAGQSNMEGADSHIEDVVYFPPFADLKLEQPNAEIKFAYSIGRQNIEASPGWTDLKSVRGMVGPELTFANRVASVTGAPIAIIKCAAGGTHLGGDWNPDSPQGFKMYPRALQLVRDSLSSLDQQNIPYRVEGFMWHQGENDMFNEEYRENYGKNLRRYIECWRRDLKLPELRFYLGELCTKTIWGMDLRPRMYSISLGQLFVSSADPLVDYVPTSHVGVEIGKPVGLHYHYGTLGQLEHGVNYATAYLSNTGELAPPAKTVFNWPFQSDTPVKLFVLAGHRNMEGERAFVQELSGQSKDLLQPNAQIPFWFNIGGGYKSSDGWQAMQPAGYYDTFGPELSFAKSLGDRLEDEQIAIAKFTHSGSQMNDWTPQGTDAKQRHIYPQFVEFIQKVRRDIERRGNKCEIAGVFYHVGENDMSMPPYRQQAAKWLAETVAGVRQDLQQPSLPWFVSQQEPTDHERVNSIDVTTAIQNFAKSDESITYVSAFEMPPQRKELVLDSAGVLRLGKLLADAYLDRSH